MLAVLAFGLALPVVQVITARPGSTSMLPTFAVDLVLVPLGITVVLICAMRPGAKRRQNLALIWILPVVSVAALVYAMLMLSIANTKLQFMELGF